MKKALFALFGLGFISIFIWVHFKSNFTSEKKRIIESNQLTSENSNNTSEFSHNIIESVFVPYWGIGDDLEESSYEEFYYFGITFDQDGDLSEDEGFRQLSKYKNSIGSRKSYLVIRLIDNNVNKKILENGLIQKKVISASVSEMKNWSFDGILLNLEMSGLGFDSTEKSITRFLQQFSGEVKKEGKSFYTALYGDTYYRARPYDVKEIAQVSDKIVIMTYDFHKARGGPGPNFPFDKGKDYPYDLKTMINEFKKDVDVQKIEITFGMFGYDWVTKSGQMAEAHSYNEIEQQFINNCKKEVY